LADALAAAREHGGPEGSDPISALASVSAPDGRLAKQCGFCYELRLHRARGYGALKAILEILADEEGLTLTEISLRLQRTPGSTKDYLSWLEDVDLVSARQKRYSFSDPLLRVFLAPSARAGYGLAAADHSHLKLLAGIGSHGAGQPVLRQRLVVRLQVLLQRRLVILTGEAPGADLGDERRELARDERANLLEPAVEIDRRDEGLVAVGEQRLFAPAAGLF